MFKVRIVSSQWSCLHGRDFSISAESGVHLENGWVPVQMWGPFTFTYSEPRSENQSV